MSEAHDFRVRWGMVIDIDKCTGCGVCVSACQKENNIPPGQDPADRMRSLNWLFIYDLSKAPGGKPEAAFLPRPCMQCGKPSCVSVCPVIATDKNEEGGIVSQIYPRCFGCRYCMASCPYHARVFNWYDPKWTPEAKKLITPNTSCRPRGVVEKCSFCHHRFMYAKDKARVAGEDPARLAEDAYIPACVEACPTGALHFGDLNNPEHKVSKLKHDPNAFRLLERLGTDPQVYYISTREWVRRLGDNYLDGEALNAPTHRYGAVGHGGGHAAAAGAAGHGSEAKAEGHAAPAAPAQPAASEAGQTGQAKE